RRFEGLGGWKSVLANACAYHARPWNGSTSSTPARPTSANRTRNRVVGPPLRVKNPCATTASGTATSEILHSHAAAASEAHAQPLSSRSLSHAPTPPTVSEVASRSARPPSEEALNM